MHIVVISGRSGSGKSSALHLLEDEGFTCIDNLPLSLLSMLITHLREQPSDKAKRLAIGIDARNIDTDLSSLPCILESLKTGSDHCQILYLDTAKDVLLRRFSETRRRHPLSNRDTGLHAAITEEDLILSPIAAMADITIDTTNLNLHELRTAVKNQLIGNDARGIAVTVSSFGFKFGVPVDADFLFDIRCLPNPYWEPHLREKSGLEPEVQQFLESEASVQTMLNDIGNFAEKWIPEFEKNNRSYVNIAIGCTGGMHRSVYLCETLAKRLDQQGFSVLIHHRQLKSKG